MDVIERQRRHLEVYVSSRGHWGAGRDLVSPGVHGVNGGPQPDGPPGVLFQNPRRRTSHPACCHHCPSQRPHHAPMGSGILQSLRIVPQVAPRVALGARVGTPVTRTGAASGSTCLC